MSDFNVKIWAFIGIVILIKQFREKEYKNKRWWPLPLMMLFACYNTISRDLMLHPIDIFYIIFTFIVGLYLGYISGNKSIIRHDKETNSIFTKGSIVSTAIFIFGIAIKFLGPQLASTSHLLATETIASLAITLSTGIMCGKNFCLHRRVTKILNSN